MKVLSFIVPSYNSERFLDKVISSFVSSEVMEKLDVIIVNDGSKDATAEIAEKYCRMYPGVVRLINQENKGHGGALNTGCAAAVGKFLKVIDADDWVETQNLPAFLTALESCDSDVVLTHHYTLDQTTGEVKKWMSYPDTFGRNYTFGEIMEQWKNFDRSLTFHGITYNTEFYHRWGIQLSEHVFYEDHEFATFPCCMAERIMPLDLFVYDYRIGDITQSVSNENQLKRIGHTETVLRRLVSEYYKLPLDENAAGRKYVCMKAQDLLMSYLTTALLIHSDRKQGREMAVQMMAYFRDRLPDAYKSAQKKYTVFCVMNLVGIRHQTWSKILNSSLYRRLMGRHSFQ